MLRPVDLGSEEEDEVRRLVAGTASSSSAAAGGGLGGGGGGFGGGGANESYDPDTYSVDDALDAVRFGRFQYALLGLTGLCWMGDAMEMLLLSFLGPASRCQWGVSAEDEGLLTSAVFVGMMLGAPAWGALADALGRKPAFMGTTATTLVAGVASAAAPTYAALLACRGCVGFGLGGVPIAYSLFIEFTPSGGRGKWGVAIEAFWTLGSMVEAALGWAVLPTLSWRWLLALSALPLVLLLAAFPVVPESPHFLAAKGSLDAADAVLRRIARINGAALPKGRLVAPPARGRGGGLEGLKKLLRPPLRVTSLLVWLAFFGIAFSYYGLVLLSTELHVDEEGGELECETTHVAPHFAESDYRDIFVSSIGELPGLVLAALLLDVVGRRATLAGTLGAFGTFLALVMVPLGDGWSTTALFLARACSMAAFTAIYVYAAEVYPTAVRSTGVGLGNGWARVGGLLCPVFSVALVEQGSVAAALVVFVGVALVTALGCWCMPVETLGRPLDADEGADEGDLELVEVRMDEPAEPPSDGPASPSAAPTGITLEAISPERAQ